MTLLARQAVHIQRLGLCSYAETLAAMQNFSRTRTPDSQDEIWLLQHYPVFSQGLNGRKQHLLETGDIPVIQSDRGGQVSYHGPGQAVFYVMLDLNRLQLGIKSLVHRLEQAVLMLLTTKGIAARLRAGAPGVYVQGKKLASIGLRVRKGCCYHGLSLNVDMDLAPFQRIHPCGFPRLEMTQLRELGISWSVTQASERLLAIFLGLLRQ